MSKEQPPEKLGANIFLLLLGGVLVWIAAAFGFVILR